MASLERSRGNGKGGCVFSMIGLMEGWMENWINLVLPDWHVYFFGLEKVRIGKERFFSDFCSLHRGDMTSALLFVLISTCL